MSGPHDALRHSERAGLRTDEDAGDVVRERAEG
jgi:hypothetical protein